VIDLKFTQKIMKYKAHPWHGIDYGKDAPHTVTAFIEIIPSDTVKYEIDKESGYLMIDRPQKFSNIVPALYGFIPRTYCKEEVAKICNQIVGRTDIIGDGDPIDILVLTEKPITHGDIIVKAVPIGGLRMIDNGEADDKIIATLLNDQVYQQWNDIEAVPISIIDRLRHYFLTYKQIPTKNLSVEIAEIYGKEKAYEVIKASMRDYENYYLK
jgi:inorganic pyrophosphatase